LFEEAIMVITSFLRPSKRIGVRPANTPDKAAIENLHARSLRGLSVGHYHAQQVEAIIAAGTLDESLLEEGHYFVAESGGEIVGCAGWSLRLPGYLAGSKSNTDPDVPRLRAVFVDPDHTRKGVARRLVHYVETDLMASGYPVVALDSMLSAVAFYRALGYRTVSHGMTTLPGNAAYRFTHMRKWLDVAIAAHA
jgi:predicted N-acetyltransferase YhbS